MAEESAKRFEAIMDKLFKTPRKSSKPNKSSPTITSNLSGVQLSRGRKRPNASSALAIGDPKSRSSAVDELQTALGSSGSLQAPLCRPWDRDDLFKRLATFKSMTWFAKPQAVSAVNCARRGWVNIDMDILACEACGARLLFSTPSSWMQQQVEKAALVFSLKLDSRHKLLCPWVDNVCDESLAQFPAKPTAVLVEDYEKRFSALLQLSALPLISSSSIDCMISPQLDEFLKASFTLENNGCADTGGSLTKEHQSASSSSYYQAQKLISLCGWELRSLPYIVDHKDQQQQSTKTINSVNESSPVSNSLVCYPHGSRNKEVESESQVSALSDPNSVVFCCGFCSATVGLWTFSAVPRPVEFLRLIGFTEVNGKNGSAKAVNENHNPSVQGMRTNFASSTSSQEKTSLNLTIAGGPPPEKHNSRATISLPVIGHSLRARFSTDSHVNQDLSLPEASITRRGADQIVEQEKNIESSLGNMQVIAQDSSKDDKVETDDSIAKSSRAQVGEGIGSSTEDNTITNGNDKAQEKNAVIVVENANDKQGDGQHDSVNEASEQLVTNNINPGGLGKSIEQAPLHKPMEFDPIRQHRTFCPWIASTAKSISGWQQTLSALQRHKELSCTLPENAPSSMEVDDPIASVKKLFSPPLAKRAKHAYTSNA